MTILKASRHRSEKHPRKYVSNVIEAILIWFLFSRAIFRVKHGRAGAS